MPMLPAAAPSNCDLPGRVFRCTVEQIEGMQKNRRACTEERIGCADDTRG
jgi:hypothetical protein